MPPTSATKSDNSLHPFTRYSFLPLALVTAVFGPLLVFLPGSNDDYWAWPIRPDMSAVWVGAGYTFGAVAISTMLLRGRWNESIVPVMATWPFSIVMLLATIVHNDRFFTDTPNYYVWLAIYLYLPIALPLMFLLNYRRDPGPSPSEVFLSGWIRCLLTVIGLAIALYSLLLVASTKTAMGAWPWQLSPLMAKVVGGWLLFIATGAILTVLEARYVAYRTYFPIVGFWFALLLFATIVNRDDLNHSLSEPLFFVALVLAVVGSAGIFLVRSVDMPVAN